MKKDFVIRINTSTYGRLVELKKEWNLPRVDSAIKVLLDYYQYGIAIVDILPKMVKVYKTKWYANKKENERYRKSLGVKKGGDK